MEINIQESTSVVTVEITGEVDLHNAKSLKNTLFEVIKKQLPVAVKLDQLRYIDSSGMATLVESFNVAKKSDIRLGLIGVTGSPLQVLKLTRLDSIFSMYDTVEAFLNG